MARQVVVIWSAELVLARTSGEPQAWEDVVQSLAVLAGLGVPGVWLATYLPEGRARVAGVAIAGSIPLAFVALGVLLPLFVRSGVGAAMAVAGAVTPALVSWQLREGIRGRLPIAGPVGVAVVLGGCVCGVWIIYTVSWPPLLIWGGFAAGLVGIAVLCSRVALVAWVGVAAFVFAVIPEASVSPEWKEKGAASAAPDVILIVVDTLRADAALDMRSYQRLARDGVAFREAQAASPWTTPAVGTLLTGLRVPDHGARRSARPGVAREVLRPSITTLAERLSRAGYDTAGLVTHDPAGVWGGFHRGFDFWMDKRDSWALPRARSERRARPAGARLLTELGLLGRPTSVDGRVLTDRAIGVLDARRPDRPLFLWVQYLDDHLPYRHMEDAPLARRHRIALDHGVAGDLTEEPFWRTDEGRDVLRAGYAFEVDFVDAQIERLLDHLGPAPDRGRVVILTSDHGEEFLEHGELLHGHSLYQELLHVPLVISGLSSRGKGGKKGRVENGVVGHLDVAPTVLAAAGIDTAGLPGHDLSEPAGSRPYVSESLWPRPTDRFRAVREGRFKLILDSEGESLLFDLEADPGETRSAAGEYPGVVARLTAAGAVDSSVDPPEPQPKDLSREDIEMLEALGYAE